MAYCTECGAEHGPEVSYCPECGTETGNEESPSNESQGSDKDLSPCKKCESEIPAGVKKCAECGYEPSDNAIFDGVRAMLYLMWSAAGGLFYLAAIGALLTGGYPNPIHFVMAIILITVFSFYPVVWLVLKIKKSGAAATDEITVLGSEIDY